MKTTLLIFLSFCFLPNAFSQTRYWQQQVDVTIQVQLNDSEQTLDGFEKLRYTNHSPDTLTYIWFHLWPNAYKNDKTAFSNQLLKLGNTAFYFSDKKQRGYINRLDFKVAGVTAKWEDHPEHIDIVKVLLPMPLHPGQQTEITTPFHVKLPALFSRSGYSNGSFQVTQWYPKPAVYDRQGWHPMPYLEQGEFYSEFGDYDITITVPQAYVVAATGVLQNAAEREWLKKNKGTPVQKKAPAHKSKYGGLKKLAASQKTLPADTTFFKTPYLTKTLQFRQQNVHDFAWVADQQFKVDFDTCRLASGKIISVYTYYRHQPKTVWAKSMSFAKEAVRFFSGEAGDYPYETLHIAESIATVGGGMEYPTLAIIGPVATEKALDRLIVHEIGHNWFYGALANNERDAPWLDEGLAAFYETKYLSQKYGVTAPLEKLLFQTQVSQKRDQSIVTTAQDFSSLNYTLVAYAKTAHWLTLLEQRAGTALFRQTLQAYVNKWMFKHPQAADFTNTFSAILPDTTVYELLYAKGKLPNQNLSTLAIVSPVVPATIKRYMYQPAKNTVLLSPLAGYNRYDQFMIGGVVTNYGLPPAALRFIVAPLYATGSRKWNGFAQINYSHYTAKRFRKIEVAVQGMGFSKSYLLDSNNKAHYERFYKIAPSIRVTLKQAPQSTVERWLEGKSFFIQETGFSKFSTAADGLTYVDSLASQSYVIHQLTWNVTDYRTLYPYQYQAQFQQGRAFYRFNATGNYFLNYAKGGGAGVRLFAAKFGYLTTEISKRFATIRYQPKLLGITGDEDYTYSSYFLGRTASYANDASVVKNSGLAAQQIMLRDGAFKLRLDPFEFLQGRSDNWVVALNFNSTLPRKLLPPQIPLKLFLDVGTYAGARNNNNTRNRILYVSGLQLSLLKNVINIYAPVFYSADFRDNLKALPEQNTFFKRLTFSIDLSLLSLQHFTRNKLSL